MFLSSRTTGFRYETMGGSTFSHAAQTLRPRAKKKPPEPSKIIENPPLAPSQAPGEDILNPSPQKETFCAGNPSGDLLFTCTEPWKWHPGYIYILESSCTLRAHLILISSFPSWGPGTAACGFGACSMELTTRFSPLCLPKERQITSPNQHL